MHLYVDKWTTAAYGQSKRIHRGAVSQHASGPPATVIAYEKRKRLRANEKGRFHVNKLFLSATGLRLEAGVTEPNMLETQVKRAMIASASRGHSPLR